VGPTKRILAGFLDARTVAIEAVTSGWRELVLRRGRPPETVDRVAYVFCVLDQFHSDCAGATFSLRRPRGGPTRERNCSQVSNLEPS
jgi:hypothetical protein